MVNISRIQTIRRKTLKTDNEGIDLPILHLLRSEKKLHGKLASAMSEEAKEGTNQWVRKIVLLEGKNLGLCMFPIVTMILNQDVEFLVFDLKHKSASGPFYHHFRMSDWWSRDHILNLLLGTSSVENNLPRNTNVQEVLNATVIPTHNGNASIETTMMIREDFLKSQRTMFVLHQHLED